MTEWETPFMEERKKLVPVIIKKLKILRDSLQQLSETYKNLRR